MTTRANTPMIAPPINGAQELAGAWQWSDPLPPVPGTRGGGAGNTGEVGFGPADGDGDIPATNRKKNIMVNKEKRNCQLDLMDPSDFEIDDTNEARIAMDILYIY